MFKRFVKTNLFSTITEIDSLNKLINQYNKEKLENILEELINKIYLKCIKSPKISIFDINPTEYLSKKISKKVILDRSKRIILVSKLLIKKHLNIMIKETEMIKEFLINPNNTYLIFEEVLLIEKGYNLLKSEEYLNDLIHISTIDSKLNLLLLKIKKEDLINKPIIEMILNTLKTFKGKQFERLFKTFRILIIKLELEISIINYNQILLKIINKFLKKNNGTKILKDLIDLSINKETGEINNLEYFKIIQNLFITNYLHEENAELIIKILIKIILFLPKKNIKKIKVLKTIDCLFSNLQRINLSNKILIIKFFEKLVLLNLEELIKEEITIIINFLINSDSNETQNLILKSLLKLLKLNIKIKKIIPNIEDILIVLLSKPITRLNTIKLLKIKHFTIKLNNLFDIIDIIWNNMKISDSIPIIFKNIMIYQPFPEFFANFLKTCNKIILKESFFLIKNGGDLSLCKSFETVIFPMMEKILKFEKESEDEEQVDEETLEIFFKLIILILKRYKPISINLKEALLKYKPSPLLILDISCDLIDLNLYKSLMPNYNEIRIIYPEFIGIFIDILPKNDKQNHCLRTLWYILKNSRFNQESISDIEILGKLIKRIKNNSIEVLNLLKNLSSKLLNQNELRELILLRNQCVNTEEKEEEDENSLKIEIDNILLTATMPIIEPSSFIESFIEFENIIFTNTWTFGLWYGKILQGNLKILNSIPSINITPNHLIIGNFVFNINNQNDWNFLIIIHDYKRFSSNSLNIWLNGIQLNIKKISISKFLLNEKIIINENNKLQISNCWFQNGLIKDKEIKRLFNLGPDGGPNISSIFFKASKTFKKLNLINLSTQNGLPMAKINSKSLKNKRALISFFKMGGGKMVINLINSDSSAKTTFDSSTTISDSTAETTFDSSITSTSTISTSTTFDSSTTSTPSTPSSTTEIIRILQILSNLLSSQIHKIEFERINGYNLLVEKLLQWKLSKEKEENCIPIIKSLFTISTIDGEIINSKLISIVLLDWNLWNKIEYIELIIEFIWSLTRPSNPSSKKNFFYLRTTKAFYRILDLKLDITRPIIHAFISSKFIISEVKAFANLTIKHPKFVEDALEISEIKNKELFKIFDLDWMSKIISKKTVIPALQIILKFISKFSEFAETFQDNIPILSKLLLPYASYPLVSTTLISFVLGLNIKIGLINPNDLSRFIKPNHKLRFTKLISIVTDLMNEMKKKNQSELFLNCISIFELMFDLCLNFPIGSFIEDLVFILFSNIPNLSSSRQSRKNKLLKKSLSDFEKEKEKEKVNSSTYSSNSEVEEKVVGDFNKFRNRRNTLKIINYKSKSKIKYKSKSNTQFNDELSSSILTFLSKIASKNNEMFYRIFNSAPELSNKYEKNFRKEILSRSIQFNPLVNNQNSKSKKIIFKILSEHLTLKIFKERLLLILRFLLESFKQMKSEKRIIIEYLRNSLISSFIICNNVTNLIQLIIDYKDLIIKNKKLLNGNFIYCLSHYSFLWIRSNNEEISNLATKLWKEIIKQEKLFKKIFIFKSTEGEIKNLIEEGFEKILLKKKRGKFLVNNPWVWTVFGEIGRLWKPIEPIKIESRLNRMIYLEQTKAESRNSFEIFKLNSKKCRKILKYPPKPDIYISRKCDAFGVKMSGESIRKLVKVKKKEYFSSRESTPINNPNKGGEEDVLGYLPDSIECQLLNGLAEEPSILLIETNGLRLNTGYKIEEGCLIRFNGIQRPQEFIWEFSNIDRVRKRGYGLQDIGLEILNSSGDAMVLLFQNQKLRNNVFSTIEKSGFGGGFHTILERIRKKISQKTKLWIKGKMFTYDYLIYINTISGRSFNDLSQYPVFPWVISDYNSSFINIEDKLIYRDLSKPMGALSKERKKFFKERYKSWDDPIIPKFHYGTHYSSAATVLFFLIRLEPYTEWSVKLQGGRFELPDRMFHKIEDTWNSASKESTADVKELIPEFYSFPEFLLNLNNNDFGIRRLDSERVDNIVLPKWANNDPVEFIIQNRRALESNYVRKKLHKWIDLIFGYKQRGPEAINKTNIFYYLTYDSVSLEDIQDEEERKIIVTQALNFGQTPSQIFKKPHPKSLYFIDREYSPTRPFNIYEEFTNQPIYSIKAFGDKCIVGEKNTLLISKKMQIKWGLSSSNLIIIENGFEVTYSDLHIGKISSCSLNGQDLVTGGKDSIINIWKIGENIVLRDRLFDHCSEITCLDIYEGLIISGDLSGIVNIWDLESLNLIRTFNLDGEKILFCKIHRFGFGEILISTKNKILFFTHNGTIISSADTSGILSIELSPREIWEDDFMIITGHETGLVTFWKFRIDGERVPKKRFIPIESFPFKNASGITSLYADEKILWVGDSEGVVYNNST